jgi:hypothetical protein
MNITFPDCATIDIEARQILVDETARNIMTFINGEKRNMEN